MWDAWQKKNNRRKALERRKKRRAMALLQIKKATHEWELREIQRERRMQQLQERFQRRSNPEPWLKNVQALGWD